MNVTYNLKSSPHINAPDLINKVRTSGLSLAQQHAVLEALKVPSAVRSALLAGQFTLEGDDVAVALDYEDIERMEQQRYQQLMVQEEKFRGQFLAAFYTTFEGAESAVEFEQVHYEQMITAADTAWGILWSQVVQGQASTSQMAYLAHLLCWFYKRAIDHNYPSR